MNAFKTLSVLAIVAGTALPTAVSAQVAVGQTFSPAGGNLPTSSSGVKKQPNMNILDKPVGPGPQKKKPVPRRAGMNYIFHTGGAPLVGRW